MNHHYTHIERKVSLQYAIRLASDPSKPAYESKKDDKDQE